MAKPLFHLVASARPHNTPAHTLIEGRSWQRQVTATALMMKTVWYISSRATRDITMCRKSSAIKSVARKATERWPVQENATPYSRASVNSPAAKRSQARPGDGRASAATAWGNSSRPRSKLLQ